MSADYLSKEIATICQEFFAENQGRTSVVINHCRRTLLEEVFQPEYEALRDRLDMMPMLQITRDQMLMAIYGMHVIERLFMEGKIILKRKD